MFDVMFNNEHISLIHLFLPLDNLFPKILLLRNMMFCEILSSELSWVGEVEKAER